MLEDFGEPSSMPKSTSSSTTCGPTSMRGFDTKLVPMGQIDRVQPGLQAFKVRPSSRDLPKHPGLAILGSSSAGLAPGDKPPR
eukprot:4315018-Amphidinium_carterae.1